MCHPRKRRISKRKREAKEEANDISTEEKPNLHPHRKSNPSNITQKKFKVVWFVVGAVVKNPRFHLFGAYTGSAYTSWRLIPSYPLEIGPIRNQNLIFWPLAVRTIFIFCCPSSAPTDNQIYRLPANQFSPSPGTTQHLSGGFPTEFRSHILGIPAGEELCSVLNKYSLPSSQPVGCPLPLSLATTAG